MSVLRRHGAAAAALVLAALAALLLLLALDARTWQSTVARDDLRFRALPSHRALWRPDTLLPGDPAGRLIGGPGALAYRRAAQLFWLSRTRRTPAGAQTPASMRATAQARLFDLARGGTQAADRSAAENLLGVLVITSPAARGDHSAVATILRDAEAQFQRAIDLDPANIDAKQNLELVLRLRRPGKGSLGRDERRGYGISSGHSVSRGGGGY